MFFVFSLGKSSLKKLLNYFPGTVPKFVSGLTHLTWQSSEEANTCSMSNPLDKSAAKQRGSEIKFQCFFSTEIKLKFKNYIYRLLPLMVSYSLVGPSAAAAGGRQGRRRRIWQWWWWWWSWSCRCGGVGESECMDWSYNTHFENYFSSSGYTLFVNSAL